MQQLNELMVKINFFTFLLDFIFHNIIFPTLFNPGLHGIYKPLGEKWAHRNSNNQISLIPAPVVYHNTTSPPTPQQIYLPGICSSPTYVSLILILLVPYHCQCPVSANPPGKGTTL